MLYLLAFVIGVGIGGYIAYRISVKACQMVFKDVLTEFAEGLKESVKPDSINPEATKEIIGRLKKKLAFKYNLQ